MKTASIRITNLKQLQQNIAVLKQQCVQQQAELRKELHFFNANKVKILLYSASNGNSKEIKAGVKLLEKMLLSYLLGGKTGTLGTYIIKSAGSALKGYAGGKLKKLFKKKKNKQFNGAEPTMKETAN
jgi:hypothetical protein